MLTPPLAGEASGFLDSSPFGLRMTEKIKVIWETVPGNADANGRKNFGNSPPHFAGDLEIIAEASENNRLN
jgi:hypothetical protein